MVLLEETCFCIRRKFNKNTFLLPCFVKCRYYVLVRTLCSLFSEITMIDEFHKFSMICLLFKIMNYKNIHGAVGSTNGEVLQWRYGLKSEYIESTLKTTASSIVISRILLKFNVYKFECQRVQWCPSNLIFDMPTEYPRKTVYAIIVLTYLLFDESDKDTATHSANIQQHYITHEYKVYGIYGILTLFKSALIPISVSHLQHFWSAFAITWAYALLPFIAKCLRCH